MTERFNFFDVFGYLMPGALLLVLVWIPLGLITDQWPSSSWGTTAIAVGFAYIAGHLLHCLSEEAFSSKFPDANGKPRYPSDLLLEAQNETTNMRSFPSFQSKFREQLLWQIKNMFGIDVNNVKAREAAFFLCRSFLIQKKSAAYFEQQHGMYELMRGVTASLLISGMLYVGIWLSSIFSDQALMNISVVPIIAALLLVSFVAVCKKGLTKEWRGHAYWLLVLVALLFGFQASRIALPNESAPADVANHLDVSRFEKTLSAETNVVQFQEQRQIMLKLYWHAKARSSVVAFTGLGAIVLLAFAAISYTAFRCFAVNFAQAIYRDFSALAPLTPPSNDEVIEYAKYLFKRDWNEKSAEEWDFSYWSLARTELLASRRKSNKEGSSSE